MYLLCAAFAQWLQFFCIKRYCCEVFNLCMWKSGWIPAKYILLSKVVLLEQITLFKNPELINNPRSSPYQTFLNHTSSNPISLTLEMYLSWSVNVFVNLLNTRSMLPWHYYVLQYVSCTPHAFALFYHIWFLCTDKKLWAPFLSIYCSALLVQSFYCHVLDLTNILAWFCTGRNTIDKKGALYWSKSWTVYSMRYIFIQASNALCWLCRDDNVVGEFLSWEVM